MGRRSSGARRRDSRGGRERGRGIAARGSRSSPRSLLLEISAPRRAERERAALNDDVNCYVVSVLIVRCHPLVVHIVRGMQWV